MTIDFKKIVIADLVFCYIPVVLFMAGWCRWEIAVPSCLLLGHMLYSLFRRTIRPMQKELLTLHPALVISVAVITLLMAFTFGCGGVFAYFFDYEKHSAIVQDISLYNWPVIYEEADSPSMLTYYVGSYLFPGLVGKIFSSRILAELMLGIVGWISMMLLLLNMLFLVDAKTTKKQIWTMVIFLGFYGMILPLQVLLFSFHDDVQFGLPHWFIHRTLQYRSSLSMLKWVWEQFTIPAFGMILLYRFRDQRHLYAIWMLPALICGTWSFIALVSYAVAYYIITCVKGKKFHADLFSWQNILCGLMGLVMVTYLAGSMTNEKPQEVQFHLITNWKYYLFSYLPFCLFAFGFYFMLIWKGVKRDAFFYITLGLLCVIPFCRAGWCNDWCMDVSMLPLFMLNICCIRFLLDKPTEKQMKRRWVTLIVCLAISSPYVFYEFYNSFDYSGMPKHSLNQYSCKNCEGVPVDLRTNYFNYNYEESFFYKYIARK